MIYNWPAGRAPRSVSFRQRGVVVASSISLAGRTQVAALDAGYWEADVNEVPVGGANAVNAWRAFVMLLEGGANEVIVPVFDLEQAPWPNAGGAGAAANISAFTKFDDTYIFDDGYGFYDPVILVTLNGAVSRGATEIDVTATAAGTIRAGMLFSVNSELHVIRGFANDGSWQVWPPFRRDYPTGIAVEMQRPTCLMRLASPAAGDLALTMGRYGFPSLTFVESIP